MRHETDPNNLDAIRLAAAFLVLYGHAFVFLGLPPPHFLSAMPLGALGVAIFFSISGYLVAQSWALDPHPGRYLIRRALRIFPGLLACVLLTVLLLGPLLTTHTFSDYVSDFRTWQYLKNMALYIVFYLPGVFETHRVPNAVNGSLWSLPVEFFLYVVLSVVGALVRRRWVYPILAIVSAGLGLFSLWVPNEGAVLYATDLRQVFIYGTYFWVGSTLYAYRLTRYFSLTSVVLACIAMYCLVLSWPVLLYPVTWLFLPWITLAFGLAYSPTLGRTTRHGDFSYGIYIYAFPVQQTLIAVRPEWGLTPHLATASVLTLGLAVASWFLVERPALRLKPAPR